MEILIIEHNYQYKKFPYSFWESRLIDAAGNYIKIQKENYNQSAAFRAVCPKDKQGNFIPTHIKKIIISRQNTHFKIGKGVKKNAIQMFRNTA